VGAVARRSVGSFSYEKRLRNGGAVVCKVRVFPLEVTHQNRQARKTGTCCEVALCLTSGRKGQGAQAERNYTSLGT
jgi:hypothetical protein